MAPVTKSRGITDITLSSMAVRVKLVEKPLTIYLEFSLIAMTRITFGSNCLSAAAISLKFGFFSDRFFRMLARSFELRGIATILQEEVVGIDYHSQQIRMNHRIEVGSLHLLDLALRRAFEFLLALGWV